MKLLLTPAGDDSGWALVDFAGFSHLDHESFQDHSLLNAEKWASKLPLPTYALDDQSAVPAVTLYSINGNACVFGSGLALTPAVNFSADYSSTWTLFPPVFNPALPGAGFYSSGFFRLSPVGNTEVPGLYAQQTCANGNARQLYKIDVPAKTATLVSSIQDNYIPLAMQFANAKTGWTLLSGGGTYISTTTDSAIAWSRPVLIDTRNLGGLRVSAAGQVAVYSVSGAYFSGVHPPAGSTEKYFRSTNPAVAGNCVTRIPSGGIW
ncbi:MAG TPA: hypothetical protein VGS79_08575 [Puia sp.]|nr:hypothetical protein [Puia sp.]